MSWLGFTGVMVLFLVTHSVPVRPQIKLRIVRAIGPRGFTIGYSILSIAMLTLLIWAAGEAPFVEVWPQMAWHRPVVHSGMLVVCLILAFSIARPNPFSFGGARNDEFDPAHPGIVRFTRHPILIAMGIWAGLHLLANGDLAHVVLFAALGSFAFGGTALVNRRVRREMGAQTWDSLNAAVVRSRYFGAPQSVPELAIRTVAGLLIFATLLALHPVIIGVPAI